MSDIKSQLLAISDSSEWEEHPFGKVAFQGAAEIARLRSALSTAREEGRRDGLEEVEKALRTLRFDSNDPWGGVESFVWRAIRALKEKQG